MKPVERWRNWTEGAPPYVPGVLTGTFYAILQYSIPGTVTAGSVVGALIQGAIFGGVMTASVASRRQRDCDAMGLGPTRLGPRSSGSCGPEPSPRTQPSTSGRSGSWTDDGDSASGEAPSSGR